MQVDVNHIIKVYKETVDKLQNDNILMKSQILQLQEENEKLAQQLEELLKGQEAVGVNVVDEQ